MAAAADERARLRETLLGSGLAVELLEEADPDAALAVLGAGAIQVVLLDCTWPHAAALGVLRQIQALELAIPVIALTEPAASARIQELLQAGAVDCVPKPALSAPRLVQGVCLALQWRAAEASRLLAGTQRALQASMEFSRLLLESSHDAIQVLDLSGSVLAQSPSGQRAFGGPIGGDEPYVRRGSPWLELWSGDSRRGAELALTEARQGRIGRFVAVRAARPGKPLWWDVTLTPVLGPTGQPDRLLVAARDVTEQRHRTGFEQQLLGIISHDLRNPISAMVMAGMLLKERLPSAAAGDVAERIVNSGQRATRLISDLLDLTRVRLGQGMSVDRRTTDLHKICQQVVGDAALASPGRTILHEAEGEGRGHWDPERLAQLVENLTSNAVSYSPPDSAVRVRSTGYGPTVSLEVHNVGEPIPGDVLPTLFQPVKRGTRAQRDERSIGLGLFIVREIVAAHRGSVKLRSSASEGTTFRVELPRS